MSSSGHNEGSGDVLAPLRASMRTRLGEFMDVYMDCKIKLAQKMLAKIELESDPVKLDELNRELNNILLSKKDVEQADETIGAFITMLQKHATAFRAFRTGGR